jgi:hypothetical protein
MGVSSAIRFGGDRQSEQHQSQGDCITFLEFGHFFSVEGVTSG